MMQARQQAVSAACALLLTLALPAICLEETCQARINRSRQEADSFELKSDQNFGQRFSIGSQGSLSGIAVKTVGLRLRRDPAAPSQTISVTLGTSWSSAKSSPLCAWTVSSSVLSSHGDQKFFPNLVTLQYPTSCSQVQFDKTYYLRISTSPPTLCPSLASLGIAPWPPDA